MEIHANLRKLKLIQLAYIISTSIYIIILYFAKSYIGIQILAQDDPTLNLVEIVLIIVSVIILLVCYFLPRWMSNIYKQSSTTVFSFYYIRSTLLLSVGVFGLIAGIFGSGWHVSLPLILVAILALILTFPTETKWNNMIESKKHESHSIDI